MTFRWLCLVPLRLLSGKITCYITSSKVLWYLGLVGSFLEHKDLLGKISISFSRQNAEDIYEHFSRI